MRRPVLIFAFSAGLAVASGIQAQGASVAEYVADYEVHYNDRFVARAQFSVAEQSDGHYAFSSSTKARGIWRLAARGMATERSVFTVASGTIAPARFEYDDGSRKGEDNYSVEFDTQAGEARISREAGPLTAPLAAGVLDRGSLQVQLMLDLANCSAPESYRYVDEDGIREYRYEQLEDREAGTGVGTFDSVRFAQTRENSSRSTVLWLAPALAWLPVRIEQYRDGELETVFTLESVSGIERQPAGCSGLR